ncbi:Hypothetical predicted protein, partial [Pelobates cultripes]
TRIQDCTSADATVYVTSLKMVVLTTVRSPCVSEGDIEQQPLEWTEKDDTLDI